MTLKHSTWLYYMTIYHIGPPGGLFRGPYGPRGPSKRPQGGPAWHNTMYYTHEKCFRAIWGHAGLFTLFCRKISGDAIYAFLVSNFWAGNGAGVKKMTNIRYEALLAGITLPRPCSTFLEGTWEVNLVMQIMGLRVIFCLIFNLTPCRIFLNFKVKNIWRGYFLVSAPLLSGDQ